MRRSGCARICRSGLGSSCRHAVRRVGVCQCGFKRVERRLVIVRDDRGRGLTGASAPRARCGSSRTLRDGSMSDEGLSIDVEHSTQANWWRTCHNFKTTGMMASSSFYTAELASAESRACSQHSSPAVRHWKRARVLASHLCCC
jgi:hypothetical protein